jgi:hypothetical protein
MVFWCGLCYSNFASSFNLKRHLDSKKHLDREHAYILRKEIDAQKDARDALLDEMDEREMRCDYDDDVLKHDQNQICQDDEVKHDENQVCPNDYPSENEDDSMKDDSSASETDFSESSYDTLSESDEEHDDDDEFCYPNVQFPSAQSEWFPFSNKQELVLSALLSHPDRPSKGFLKFLWGIFFCLGLNNLPSLKKIEKIISQLPNSIKTKEAITQESNSVFHYIPPSALIGQLFSIPEIRRKIELYVNDDESLENLSCIAQADKIRENFDLQTPMINLKGIRMILVRFQRGIEYDIHILVRGFIKIIIK